MKKEVKIIVEKYYCDICGKETLATDRKWHFCDNPDHVRIANLVQEIERIECLVDLIPEIIKKAKGKKIEVEIKEK